MTPHRGVIQTNFPVYSEILVWGTSCVLNIGGSHLWNCQIIRNSVKQNYTLNYTIFLQNINLPDLQIIEQVLPMKHKCRCSLFYKLICSWVLFNSVLCSNWVFLPVDWLFKIWMFKLGSQRDSWEYWVQEVQRERSCLVGANLVTVLFWSVVSTSLHTSSPWDWRHIKDQAWTPPWTR